jgi:hypothetical protein
MHPALYIDILTSAVWLKVIARPRWRPEGIARLYLASWYESVCWERVLSSYIPPVERYLEIYARGCLVVICKHCGKEGTGDAIFCVYCGKSSDTADQEVHGMVTKVGHSNTPQESMKHEPVQENTQKQYAHVRRPINGPPTCCLVCIGTISILFISSFTVLREYPWVMGGMLVSGLFLSVVALVGAKHHEQIHRTHTRTPVPFSLPRLKNDGTKTCAHCGALNLDIEKKCVRCEHVF